MAQDAPQKSGPKSRRIDEPTSTYSSRWTKCISSKGNIRGVAIQATDLVQCMADRHKVEAELTRSLGEAVIGSLLIASYCKQGERVNLNIQGSGQIRQALIDAYPEGHCRGYVIGREGIHKGDATEGPWGAGLLSVLRTKTSEKQQPYIGTVPLVTGHLAKDLTFYWAQSEQVPSAVGIAVNVEGKTVTAAGGFLVQVLPGATEAEVKQVEQHINEMHSLAKELNENGDPVKLLSRIFQDSTFMIVEEKPLEFRCECTWDRVERSLALVGVKELQSMMDDENEIVVTCDFCNTEYKVSKDKLNEMLQGVQSSLDDAVENLRQAAARDEAEAEAKKSAASRKKKPESLH